MAQIPIGSTLYLHRSPTPHDPITTHLLITAHGAAGQGSMAVPSWAALHFYGRHGAELLDPGALDIIMGKYQVVETAWPGDVCNNYILDKFKDVDESYYDLQAHVATNSAGLNNIQALMAEGTELANRKAQNAWKSRNYGFHFDVLTIRDRWCNLAGTSLASALAKLDHAGYRYENIHCSFCRRQRDGGVVSAKPFGS